MRNCLQGYAVANRLSDNLMTVNQTGGRLDWGSCFIFECYRFADGALELCANTVADSR